MIPFIAPLALTASTAALLALPLTPALRELISKHDAGPLMTRKDDGKIDNFTISLRKRCEPFEPRLMQRMQRNENEFLDLPAGKLLVLGQAGPYCDSAQTNVLVLCAREIELPDGFQSLEDFYSHDDVRAGRDNLFRVLLSEGNIMLGDGSKILRWVHAQHAFVAGENCTLFGRTSAGESLTLANGCKFERIYAPVVNSSSSSTQLNLRNESAPFAKLAQTGMGRSRVHGKAHLPIAEQHFGNLVATKSLKMDERACIFGSAKANGDASLDSGAEVHGSLVSTHRIHLASGCFVKGPLIAEQEIVIDSGVQIGLKGFPTTVSAPRIRIAPGSVLHGTVWARAEGRVGD